MSPKSAGVMSKPKERRHSARVGEVKDINLKAIVRLSTNKVCPVRDRKSTRLNSSHTDISRMPSSA